MSEIADGKLINNSNDNNLTTSQKKNGMFNFLKKETIFCNEQPKMMAYGHCAPKYNCEKKNLRDKRVYKADIRQPIRAVRKETKCNDNKQCQTTTKLYKDHYSGIDIDTNTLATNCPNTNGSLPTGKLNNINLGGTITKSQSGITTRTRKPLIRSGMQPNTAGQQNSGLSQYETDVTKKRNTYSYSFRELLNNRRKSTIEKSLACTKNESSKEVNGYGGQCKNDPNCLNGKVIDRLNNKKFYKQGSVDSSTRLERLKLDTIKGQSQCPIGTQTNYSGCNGPNVPFVRAQMGPPSPVTDISCTNQRKYKGLFNINHTEVNYPQTSALARVRGAVSHKTTVNPNGGVCCNDDPPQLLK